jgi:hypothetical protein
MSATSDWLYSLLLVRRQRRPFQRCVAQVLVARDRIRGQLRRAHGRAHPQAQPVPGAVRIAVGPGHLPLEHRRPDGRQQAGLRARHRFAEVSRHEQVGGRLRALAAEPLEQLRRRAAAQLEPLAGGVLEGLEGRLVAVLGAAVVDDHVGAAAERDHREREQRSEQQAATEQQAGATSDQGRVHRCAGLRFGLGGGLG